MTGNKEHVFFLFTHKIYVVDICQNRLPKAILTNMQNMFLGGLTTMFLNIFNYPSHLELKKCSIQNVFITSYCYIELGLTV